MQKQNWFFFSIGCSCLWSVCFLLLLAKPESYWLLTTAALIHMKNWHLLTTCRWRMLRVSLKCVLNVLSCLKLSHWPASPLGQVCSTHCPASLLSLERAHLDALPVAVPAYHSWSERNLLVGLWGRYCLSLASSSSSPWSSCHVWVSAKVGKMGTFGKSREKCMMSTAAGKQENTLCNLISKVSPYLLSISLVAVFIVGSRRASLLIHVFYEGKWWEMLVRKLPIPLKLELLTYNSDYLYLGKRCSVVWDTVTLFIAIKDTSQTGTSSRLVFLQPYRPICFVSTPPCLGSKISSCPVTFPLIEMPCCNQ